MNRGYKFTASQEETIKRMAKDGRSYTDIARSVNATKDIVRCWIARNGIVKPSSARWKNDDTKTLYIQRDSCAGCGYRGYTGGCNYILIEGCRRGCPADNCDKYIPRKQLKRRSTEEEEVEDKEMTDEELIEYVNEQETAHNAQEGA